MLWCRKHSDERQLRQMCSTRTTYPVHTGPHTPSKPRAPPRMLPPCILDGIFCRRAWPRVPLVRQQWDCAADEGCRVCNIRLPPVRPSTHLPSPRRRRAASSARWKPGNFADQTSLGAHLALRARLPVRKPGMRPARGRLVRPAARPATGVKYRSPSTRVAEGRCAQQLEPNFAITAFETRRRTVFV